MNSLQKLKQLLEKEGRVIKFGVLTDEQDSELITLSVGDSANTFNALGDDQSILYPTISVNVYSTDYISGYDLLSQLKSEIKAALKDSMTLIHIKDIESEFDKDKHRHVFKSHFKEIQI